MFSLSSPFWFIVTTGEASARSAFAFALLSACSCSKGRQGVTLRGELLFCFSPPSVTCVCLPLWKDIFRATILLSARWHLDAVLGFDWLLLINFSTSKCSDRKRDDKWGATASFCRFLFFSEVSSLLHQLWHAICWRSFLFLSLVLWC